MLGWRRLWVADLRPHLMPSCLLNRDIVSTIVYCRHDLLLRMRRHLLLSRASDHVGLATQLADFVEFAVLASTCAPRLRNINCVAHILNGAGFFHDIQ